MAFLLCILSFCVFAVFGYWSVSRRGRSLLSLVTLDLGRVQAYRINQSRVQNLPKSPKIFRCNIVVVSTVV
ncbi:hypothetical protein QBC47DRAFT_384128 [Echria macrotheca]|uniref:Uncharacterized protein n=1 Tax=Echria macrotheca TaxID=438768 RepID=A0AAJ0BA64_9PEZI|nr:hypothetical protein QBC47DRAFT_384128 [Echria macrotheca]